MFLRSAISVLSLTAFTLVGGQVWATSPNVNAPHHRPVQHVVCSTQAYEAAMATMHREMHAPLSGNADIDFARQMLPHHQGAVEMAKIQLQYGHDERLKTFSRWIIRAQEQEIGFMKNWLFRRDNEAAPANAKDYYGNAMMAMHHDMMIDYSGDADLDFVRGMIPHHQGAVAMAEILISDGNDPELHALAEDIYNSQNYEIAWMQDWLASNTAILPAND